VSPSSRDDWLSIGEVSERTGLAPATLRMWEVRHGFPVPDRLESGHRRYAATDVDTIRDVLRRREAGVRLDVAIGQAVRAALPDPTTGTPSVFAGLRTTHTELPTYRLRKPTLVALSWAIEDEFCARAEQPYLFGAFQRRQYFLDAEHRWADLARTARQAFVFADFPERGVLPPLVPVPLPEDAPMRREWAVVCDAPGLSAALSGFELPGQQELPERERVFECTWTLDPVPVRDAARTCARVAASNGVPEGEQALAELAAAPESTTPDPSAATRMSQRVVAYADRLSNA
jgi:MerR family transcriptional regulator, light-induced transcriptional regulator